MLTYEQAVKDLDSYSRTIERLRKELDWWKQQPTQQCDSKCGYCKTGDAMDCWCGRAQWEAEKPVLED